MDRNYEYLGDPAGSRCLNLENIKINKIDQDGLWFTGYDEDGMEVEVTVDKMTGRHLQAALTEWGYR